MLFVVALLCGVGAFSTYVMGISSGMDYSVFKISLVLFSLIPMLVVAGLVDVLENSRIKTVGYIVAGVSTVAVVGLVLLNYSHNWDHVADGLYPTSIAATIYLIGLAGLLSPIVKHIYETGDENRVKAIFGLLGLSRLNCSSASAT